MIVVEREVLARWVREMKRRQTRDNGVDYYTAYLSALTAVEAFMAVMPSYDTDRMKDVPIAGSFTPRTVESILNENPPKELRFKDGHCKWFTPSEVRELLEKDLDGRI